jgi:hypothetical protein
MKAKRQEETGDTQLTDIMAHSCCLFLLLSFSFFSILILNFLFFVFPFFCFHLNSSSSYNLIWHRCKFDNINVTIV